MGETWEEMNQEDLTAKAEARARARIERQTEAEKREADARRWAQKWGEGALEAILGKLGSEMVAAVNGQTAGNIIAMIKEEGSDASDSVFHPMSLMYLMSFRLIVEWARRQGLQPGDPELQGVLPSLTQLASIVSWGSLTLSDAQLKDCITREVVPVWGCCFLENSDEERYYEIPLKAVDVWLDTIYSTLEAMLDSKRWHTDTEARDCLQDHFSKCHGCELLKQADAIMEAQESLKPKLPKGVIDLGLQ